MWYFIARRVLYAIPILLGVSLMVFLLLKLVPGDAADIMIPPEAPREVAAMIRARFGLDQPVHIQYLRWLQSMATGNFGTSIFTNQPVASELFSALSNTFMIAIPAVMLGFSCGVLLGTLAALNNGTWLDKLFSSVAIAGVSLPHYWVGMVLVAIFAVVHNVSLLAGDRYSWLLPGLISHVGREIPILDPEQSLHATENALKLIGASPKQAAAAARST